MEKRDLPEVLEPGSELPFPVCLSGFTNSKPPVAGKGLRTGLRQGLGIGSGVVMGTGQLLLQV